MSGEIDRYTRTAVEPYDSVIDPIPSQVMQQLRSNGVEPVVIVVKENKAPDRFQPNRRDLSGVVFAICGLFAIVIIVAIIAVSCANAPVINPPAHNNPSCILFCQ